MVNLKKSLCGTEMSTELTELLNRSGIEPSNLIGPVSDCVSSNLVARTVMSVMYKGALQMGCFAHSIDHVGEHFLLPLEHQFTEVMVGMMSRNFEAADVWQSLVGRAFPTASDTRWWSRWELIAHVWQHWYVVLFFFF